MRGGATAPASLVGPPIIEALLELARGTPAGAFVEVGVYSGGTAWHLAHLAEVQHRPVFLYDTFAGIPHRDAIDSHRVGDFADASVDLVRELIPYAQVLEGVFPASAVPMGPIAFVHLDCDVYRSYRQALDYLAPRMVPDGVIWCDDVPCLAGATLAVAEFARAWEPMLVTEHPCGKTYIRF